MRLPFHRSSARGGPRPGVPATLHSSTRQQHLARSLRDPREGHNARYLEGEGAAVRRARLDWARRRECGRSEEHTSELQSLMRISYAVFCLKKKTQQHQRINYTHNTVSYTTKIAVTAEATTSENVTQD